MNTTGTAPETKGATMEAREEHADRYMPGTYCDECGADATHSNVGDEADDLCDFHYRRAAR